MTKIDIIMSVRLVNETSHKVESNQNINLVQGMQIKCILVNVLNLKIPTYQELEM